MVSRWKYLFILCCCCYCCRGFEAILVVLFFCCCCCSYAHIACDFMITEQTHTHTSGKTISARIFYPKGLEAYYTNKMFKMKLFSWFCSVIVCTLADGIFFVNKIVGIRKTEFAKLENRFLRFSGLADFRRKTLCQIHKYFNIFMLMVTWVYVYTSYFMSARAYSCNLCTFLSSHNDSCAGFYFLLVFQLARNNEDDNGIHSAIAQITLCNNWCVCHSLKM